MIVEDVVGPPITMGQCTPRGDTLAALTLAATLSPLRTAEGASTQRSLAPHADARHSPNAKLRSQVEPILANLRCRGSVITFFCMQIITPDVGVREELLLRAVRLDAAERGGDLLAVKFET